MNDTRPAPADPSAQMDVCMWCRLPIQRADAGPWRTADGTWRCPQHPERHHSRLTPHRKGGTCL